MPASDQIAPPTGNGAAYRFVYVLPLSPTEVFVEDTYYADQPRMDAEMLKGRVAEYAHRNGWKGEVVDQEAGILPVISGGNFAAAQAEIAIPGVALAGARGGFSHPLTSYTLPFAADNALAIARLLAARPGLSDKRAGRLLRAPGEAALARHRLLPDAQPDAVRGRRAGQAGGGVRTFLRAAGPAGRTFLCRAIDMA